MNKIKLSTHAHSGLKMDFAYIYIYNKKEKMMKNCFFFKKYNFLGCIFYTTVFDIKTDNNKGDDVVVCLPGAKIEAITERIENTGFGQGWICFSTRRDK